MNPWRYLGCIAAIALLAACSSQPNPAPEDLQLSAGAFASAGSLLRDREDAEPFSKAMAQATSAATMAATAKTQAQWQASAAKWRKAIALLKTVPKTDPNYKTAQEKLAQYQQNLDSALEKATPPK